jgi:hypothetical protein
MHNLALLALVLIAASPSRDDDPASNSPRQLSDT